MILLGIGTLATEPRLIDRAREPKMTAAASNSCSDQPKPLSWVMLA